MSVKRFSILGGIVKGLLFAVVLTVLFMFAAAGLSLILRFSDRALMWINQGIKVISIVVGTLASVGLGGEQGFIRGIVIGLLYMIFGYFFYAILGGGEIAPLPMLGEMLLGATLGGVFGALFANAPVRHKKPAKA